MTNANASPDVLESDACYLALKTHDARFDGSFFTAVTSTGIYCRPVCRVKLPRRENCRFFRHAAQAEAEGFKSAVQWRDSGRDIPEGDEARALIAALEAKLAARS